MAFPQDVQPTIPTANQLSGDPLDLALTMFSGEVLAAMMENNQFLARTRSMNVGAGASHQFPLIGKATARKHKRGESLLDTVDPANVYLSNIESAEKKISVDRPLISSFTVDDWDSLIAHAPFRSEYASQVGYALSRGMDKQIAQVLVLAARASNPFTAAENAGRGGITITAANMDTSATVMLNAMRDAAIEFESKDVRSTDIAFAVRPSMYYQLVADGSFLNVDKNPGGNGSQASGIIDRAYGFEIFMSNNIPSTDVDADTRTGVDYNTYNGDFTRTQAIGFHRDAVGTVYREGVTVETDRLTEYQQDLVVARLISGTGILRSECAIELALPTP